MSARGVRVLLLVLFMPVDGIAAEPADEVRARADVPPRNYGNLRLGASTSSRGTRPDICLEISPIERFAVEGCGNGSGFLQNDPTPEIAHFRGKLLLGSARISPGWLQLQLNAGFAELQLGEDGAGFNFTSAGPLGSDTAGPEVGLTLRALVPVSEDLELVGQLRFDTAWMPYAPELVTPMSAWQPSAGFTLGFGF